MNATVEEITRLVIAALAREGVGVADAALRGPLTLPSPPVGEREKNEAAGGGGAIGRACATAARGTAAGLGVAVAGGCGCGCGGQRASQPAVETGSWPCAERLISQATLDGRLEGVRQLLVSRRTVITPAAADLLRERGVKVIRGETARASVERKFVVALDAGNRSLGDLTASLAGQGIQVIERRAPLAELIPWLERQAASAAQPLVLLAAQPHAAACQVNRRPALRAAVVLQPAEWSAIATGFAPNVAVLEGARWDSSQIVALAGAWFGQGQRTPCGCSPSSPSN